MVLSTFVVNCLLCVVLITLLTVCKDGARPIVSREYRLAAEALYPSAQHGDSQTCSELLCCMRNTSSGTCCRDGLSNAVVSFVEMLEIRLPMQLLTTLGTLCLSVLERRCLPHDFGSLFLAMLQEDLPCITLEMRFLKFTDGKGRRDSIHVCRVCFFGVGGHFAAVGFQ